MADVYDKQLHFNRIAFNPATIYIASADNYDTLIKLSASTLCSRLHVKFEAHPICI